MEKQNLKALFKSLSLSEKINQLVQLPGELYGEPSKVTAAINELHIDHETVREAGSIINISGAKVIREVQEKYTAEHPHHIPLLIMSDVINGFRTIAPIPLAQGCMFDLALTEKLAHLSAIEASSSGMHVTFSPMIDLVRDLRWGRVMESAGEDPWLNAQIAAAMVRGYQHGPDEHRISACLKHFVGYGAPVAGREYNAADISEIALYEDYLPPFKAGVEAGAGLVMAAFNSINRMPATGDKSLIRDVLRHEWAFEGVVISDYGAIGQLVRFGLAETSKEAVYLAIKAGIDIDMGSGLYARYLPQLVQEGRISIDLIDEAAWRVLLLKNKMGLFEHPFAGMDRVIDEAVEIAESSHALVRKACYESSVLLKNDGVLPINKHSSDRRKIAFIGPYVDEPEISGNWAIYNHLNETVTLKEGITEKEIQAHVVFAQGCERLDYGMGIPGIFGAIRQPHTQAELEKLQEEALLKAQEADVVVLALGEHEKMSGEGESRTSLGLPSEQMALFEKICAINPNVVVVLFSGRPLSIRELTARSRALLQVWFPGTDGGSAIADMLFGDAVPSGRLSMSWPYNVGQIPVYYNELRTGAPFSGDLDDIPTTRFASKYIDAPNAPLYPFGFGLSYTKFEYSDILLDQTELRPDSKILAVVTVKNAGKIDSDAVVQMYIQDVNASVVRPVRQLKGFQRVSVLAGHEVEISFEISEDMLCFYNAELQRVVEPGLFRVFIGADSTTTNVATFSYTRRDDGI